MLPPQYNTGCGDNQGVGGSEERDMNKAESPAIAPKPRLRRFHLTPDRVVLLLLVAECLLWLSERLGWPAWHMGYAVLTAAAIVIVTLLLMLAWFAAALIFRLRFQFSMRSLLLLVVAVAVACSWLPAEIKKASLQQEAAAAIKNFARIRVSDQSDPEWLRRLLGYGFFNNIEGVYFNRGQAADGALEHIQNLATLETLVLNGTQVTDAGIEHITGLKQLRSTTASSRMLG
jgi:hypothetical protein